MLVKFEKKLKLFMLPACAAFCLFFLCSQAAANELGKVSVYGNPLGFLQFGPIVGVDFKVAPKFTIGGHLRYASLGALTWATAASDDEEPEMDNFGIGVDCRYFFLTESGPRHAPYIGGIAEYYSGSFTGSDSWDWEGDTDGFVIAANGGYRWRMSSGFFLNTGGYLGMSSEHSEWKYTSGAKKGKTEKEDEGTLFLMAELSLGWEF